MNFSYIQTLFAGYLFNMMAGPSKFKPNYKISLLAIAGPIAFNILSNYGTNSFIDIFVEHIGDEEAFVDESVVVVEIELVFSSQNRAHHAVERSPIQDEERLFFLSKHCRHYSGDFRSLSHRGFDLVLAEETPVVDAIPRSSFPTVDFG